MNRLRNSASSLLIVALAAPAPAMAQNANPFKGQVPLCSDADAPCVTEGGMVRMLDGTEAAPADAAAALGIALPGAEAETVVQETPAAEAPAAEVVAEPKADAAPAEPAPAETAAETAPAEAAATPAAEPAQAEAAAEPAPAQPAAAEAAPKDETQTAETPTPAADAPVETAAEQPAPVTPAEPETAAETATTEAPVTQTASETKTPVAPSEGQVAAETPADAAPMTEAETAAQAADEAAAEAQVTTEAAPAAATQADAEAKVTSETVTADDVRSSDQEFATKATGDAAAAKTSGKGLSNFEKVLLLGAGALAVGAILKNGDKVVSNSGDRVVVDRAGQLVVLKDDDSLLRQPGNEVQTETFNDGSTRTTVARPDGTKVVTIRAADGRVLRRARVMADGTQYVLFDDTRQFEQVDVSTLPAAKTDQINYGTDDNALRAALAATSATQLDRSFSLSQIRNIRAVRDLAPEIELTNVTFASGSAAITPSEAEELSALGRAMSARIAENPREVFLIEGHTDAVGNATYNLALSDRRAESLALALTEYFDVPPENMVVQGYGERYLKIRTPDAERANRRAVVRVITPLLGEIVAAK